MKTEKTRNLLNSKTEKGKIWNGKSVPLYWYFDFWAYVIFIYWYFDKYKNTYLQSGIYITSIIHVVKGLDICRVCGLKIDGEQYTALIILL